jgi:hypothetical protein
MLRAVAAANKRNDRIDASKFCDCLRCDFLPECYYVAPTVIRERRRTLRYPNDRMIQPVDRFRRLVEHSRHRQNQLGDMCASTRFHGREACLGKLHEM